MTALRIYEKLRLYQPLGLLFQPGANMPPGATAAMPPCILCQQRSRLPPAKTGWIEVDGEGRLFLVCQDCDCDDDEVQRKIVTQVSEPALAE